MKAVNKVKKIGGSLLPSERSKPAQLLKFARKNQNKKLPPLKNAVRKPLFITVTLINVAVIIFFNVAMLITLYANATLEIKSVSEVVENEYAAASTGDSINVRRLTMLFNNEYERRRAVFDTSLLFVDAEGGVIYFSTPMDEARAKSIDESVRERFSKHSDPTYIPIDGDVLMLRGVNITSADGTMCFAAVSMRTLFYSLGWSNIVLLIIVALSIVASITASHIISGKISRPIKSLSEHMEIIGDGDIFSVPISEDSEELNKLTVSINEMLTKLNAYSESHTHSIQNMSHDLRTPLMSISGYAEGIKYGVMDYSEAADVIIAESRKLTGVVDKLLILSELDTLNQPINMKKTPLASFIDECVTGMNGYAMKRSVNVIASYPDSPVSVLADSQLLNTIMQNLLSNAIRYASVLVTVSVENTSDRSVISVADDGPGLSDEDLEHLFMRHYIGKTGHSGLGLSAAKSAAEYMGCELTGENSAAGGAVFRVSFPKYE